MFYYKKQIKNSCYLGNYDGQIFILKNYCNIVAYSPQLEIQWESTESGGRRLCIKNDIIYCSGNGRWIKCFDKNIGNLILKKDNLKLIWNQPCIYGVIVNNYIGEKGKLSMYANSLEDIIWRTDYRIGGCQFYNNAIVCFTDFHNENILTAISSEKGINLWQADLSSYCSYTDSCGEYQKGKIERIIGVYKGIIWVTVSNCTLLGLDEKAGEIRYKIRKLPNTEKLTHFEYAFLDEEKETIYNLTSFSFSTIDCNTGRISYWDISAELKKCDLYPSLPYRGYDGDNIYCIASSTGTLNDKITRFHIPTRKIILEYIFSQENNLRLLEMKYDSSRIYVRDSNNTLHIFENE
jgi:hypothetical protein